MTQSLFSATDSAAYSVLCGTSAAAAAAETASEAAEGVLCALKSAGLIDSGAVEILSSPPLRIAVGGFETVADSDLPTDAHVVPTRFAAPARLLVHPSDRLPFGMMEAAAAQIALALDRIHLLDETERLNERDTRRIEEVSTVYEIDRAIDSVEIGRLLEIITEKAARVMRADACSLMRLDPQTQQLTIAAAYGLEGEVVAGAQQSLGEGIAGRVAESGEPLLIVDSENDPRLLGLRLRPEIGSSIVVPMKDEEGRVTGVLSILRLKPAPDFGDDSLRLFTVLASQASLAINNAGLYADLRRRVAELSTISDLTQSVISTLNLSSLLEVVADDIIRVLRFDRLCVYLLDRPSRRYIPRIVRGYRPDVIGANPVRAGEGVVGIVAKKQMPIIENDARTALQPMRGFARSLGTNSFAAIPILSKGQAIGVVIADNRGSAMRIPAERIELLTTFVSQAALAIENAQLYEDREQRYQEMNRLATQTDNILRSIAASVIVVDASGRVTRWNKGSEDMWGISEEDALELGYAGLVERLRLPDEESSRLHRAMSEVSSTGKAQQIPKLFLHPADRPEVIVNLLISPLIDRQGERHGVVHTMRDVTPEIRMEEELSRMRRLADVGQLAAKVAHEVRNPLSSIKGAAQLMRHEYEDLPALCEFLDIIIDEVDKLKNVTTELLDFARPMQLDLRWLDLNDLIAHTLGFMAHYLKERKVAARYEPDPDMPEILADPAQVDQVIKNLVINGVQAMADGGSLALESRYDPEAAKATIRITDTGEGIPDDRIGQIFQPFFTSKAKGAGLGLPIVRKIVENHGGQIRVSSTVGQGTTFSVTLPSRPMVSELAPRISREDGNLPPPPLPDA